MLPLDLRRALSDLIRYAKNDEVNNVEAELLSLSRFARDAAATGAYLHNSFTAGLSDTDRMMMARPEWQHGAQVFDSVVYIPTSGA